MSGVTIRAENDTDAAAIHALLHDVFPGGAEARLVDALREAGDLVLSLVAQSEGRILGCAQFSRMTAPFPALALGPIAVAATSRRRGIGSELIRGGLRRARENGWIAVFCLGDPEFYARFGFSVAQAAGFSSPYAGPNFIVTALGNALPATDGTVHYAAAFADL